MKRILYPILIALAMLIPVSAFAGETQVSSLRAPANISEGYYYLIPECAKNRALTIRGDSTAKYATAVSRSFQKKSSQIFYISKVGSGLYTLRNKKSNMVLGVKNASTRTGTIVRQSVYCGLNSQKWYIFKVGKYYTLQAAMSKCVLKVSNSSRKNNIAVRTCLFNSTSKGLHWKLVKVGGSSDSSQTDDDDTVIKSKYKTTTKTGMSKSDYSVLTNIIGAVETGGQIYGNRDYADYTPPYSSTSLEVTITLGWGAYFGNEAQHLIQTIKNEDPKVFAKIDKKGLIAKALTKNWVKTKWNPTAEEKELLKKLIVTNTGKRVQDDMFKALMKDYVKDCTAKYTKNTWAIMMYCEIRHLGGQGGVNRIFDRCKAKKSYSLDTIMWALQQDQKDTGSSYQVGDSVFWSRHLKCVEFIQKYA